MMKLFLENKSNGILSKGVCGVAILLQLLRKEGHSEGDSNRLEVLKGPFLKTGVARTLRRNINFVKRKEKVQNCCFGWTSLLRSYLTEVWQASGEFVRSRPYQCISRNWCCWPIENNDEELSYYNYSRACNGYDQNYYLLFVVISLPSDRPNKRAHYKRNH